MKLLILLMLLLSSCTFMRHDLEPAPEISKSKTPDIISGNKRKESADKKTEEKVKPSPIFEDSIKVALAWEEKELSFLWNNVTKLDIILNDKIVKTIQDKKGTFTAYQKDNSLLLKTNGYNIEADSLITIACSGGHLGFGKNEYRGIFIVKFIKGKGLFLINHLEVEDYLKGVVPNEMGKYKDPSYREALKSQSIVARSYTYAKYKKHSSLGFNLKASVADQVYKGLGSEFQQCSEAVDATKSVIMLYDNLPVTAFYHSTCGGKTSSFSGSWYGMGDVAYLQSRDDHAHDGSDFCKKSFKANWTVKYPKWLLNKHLRNNYKIDNVTSVSISETSNDGRVATLLIKTKSKDYEFHGDKVRWVLQKEDKILPSSKFTIKEDKTNYYFVGQGYGHGVGMCQFGAMGRSIAGQNATEILNAYYTNVEIVSLDEMKNDKSLIEAYNKIINDNSKDRIENSFDVEQEELHEIDDSEDGELFLEY